MKFILLTLLFIAFKSHSQQDILIIGNYTNICSAALPSSQLADALPDDLTSFRTIFLFSSASSRFTTHEIEQLIQFIEQGGGLYIGSENWPLQEEAHQMTQRLYTRESYGNFKEKNADSAERGNLNLKDLNYIPAGESTVAFPMDYRLTVEAWIEDQPLILSGYIEKGRVIVDGGYSRFYCENMTTESKLLFTYFLKFLMEE